MLCNNITLWKLKHSEKGENKEDADLIYVL